MKNRRSFSTRRLTTLAFLTAIALIIAFIESMLPPVVPLAPGAKLGLGNAAVLLALILLGECDAFIVMMLKCLLGGIITGGLSGLVYSASAGLVALVAEILLVRFALGKVSVGFISLAGAVLFNATQLFVACAVTGVNLLALLPALMAAGMLAGAFSGLLCYHIIKRLPFGAFGALAH